ncbi:MAG: hypothetical protein ABIO70_27145 [Pseudomonadota bacterium]
MTRTLLSASALLLLGACSEKAAEDYAGPHCEDTPTVITLEEATALGFSGADVLALAEGIRDETLTWTADESTTPVHVTVTYDAGEVRFVDSEPVYPEGEDGAIQDIAVVCDDRVEVDVTVTVVTDDGGFDEAWDVALASIDGLSAGASVDLESFTGSFTYDTSELGEYEELSYNVMLGFDEAGASGDAFAQAQGCEEDCDEDECTCWASQDPIATWGPVAE